MPTNFTPGTTGETGLSPPYRLFATNVGGAPASGAVTLKVTLPAGLVAPVAVIGDTSPSLRHAAVPVCALAGQTITCTSSGPIYPAAAGLAPRSRSR